MEKFDVFEAIQYYGFDSPEPKDQGKKKERNKEVYLKIAKKIKDLRSEFTRETDETKRKRITEQVNNFESVFKKLFPQGDLTHTEEKNLTERDYEMDGPVFKKLAQEKIASELESFQTTVAVLKEDLGATVTKQTILKYRKETHLSQSHVEETFKNAGYKIVGSNKDIANIKAKIPKFPTNADSIDKLLEELRKHPQARGASDVTDLYSFAAYLKEDKNVEVYRKMPRQELSDIFQENATKYAQSSTGTPGNLCVQLCAKANQYVFNSDENVKAYRSYLDYHNSELTKLFGQLKKISKSQLQDDKIAQTFIDKISKYFPGDQVALAIYNKEAGLDKNEDDYYLPEVWYYQVQCKYCGQISKFRSEEEAIRENSCQFCKKPLFKKCGHCGKNAPEILDTCPYCNHEFPNPALFSKYYQQAKDELNLGEFNAARQSLTKAKNAAAPGDKGKIDQLSRQIEEDEKEFNEPINKLRELMAEQKFCAAKTKLGEIKRKYPRLNVAEFDQKIAGELSKADSKFASANNLSPSKKADVCIEILMQCVDYLKALSFLQATPPLPSGSITVTPRPEAGKINVSWGRSTEQGVLYRLVRRAGRIAPASENDGDILRDKTRDTSFIDESVKPGQTYAYSVFVVRAGVFSRPISKTCVLYSEVKNCHISQHGERIRITWEPPANSQGATIVRACEGRTVTLSGNAHGSYEDSDIHYGKTYTYKIISNYEGGSKSAGIEQVFTLLPIVDSFKISAERVKDNLYKVSWDIKQGGVDLRVLVNGDVLSTSKSDDGSVEVSLPEEKFCTIRVCAYSGGDWLNSENSVEANTFTSCKIDRKATCLTESQISGQNSYQVDIKIYMAGSVPSNVSAFYYTVRTAGEHQWAALQEIGNSSDIQRVPIENYRQKGYISFSQKDVPREIESYYISVFTCHSVKGNEIVSEPQKMRLSRPLIANLFWAVIYRPWDGLRLEIALRGNKLIESVPELLLCVCDGNQFVMSPSDANAQTIMKISSKELDTPVGEYRKTYLVEANLPKRPKKYRYFLFLGTEGIMARDNIAVRPKEGFSGKL